MTSAPYFVTGANGFIGSVLCRALQAKAESLTMLVHDRNDHPFLAGIDGAVVRGDIASSASYRHALSERSVVVHCAGHVSFAAADGERTRRVNVEGTRALLDACLQAHVSAVLFVSAGAVFRPSPSSSTIIDEQSAMVDATANAYARSKWEAEELCLRAAQQGLRVVIVNPSTSYGAGDFRLRAGGRVVSEILRNRAGIVPPGGTSWIDVDDLVAGMLLAVERGRVGERYILSSGNVSYFELFSTIAGCAGRPAPRLVLPRWMKSPLLLAADAAERLARRVAAPLPVPTEQIREAFCYKWFSADKARRELGFSPRTSLAESVGRTNAFNQTHRLAPATGRPSTLSASLARIESLVARLRKRGTG